MSRLELLNSRQRLGKVVSSAVTIPQGVNYFRAFIARNSWVSRGEGGVIVPVKMDDGKSEADLTGLDTEVVRVSFWVSYDGGATWRFSGHIGTTGGDVFQGARGDLVIDTVYATWLREPSNRFRKLRVTLDCGEMLNTSVHVEFDTLLDPNVRRDDHHSIAVVDADQATGATATTLSTPSIDTSTADYLAAFAGNEKYPTDRDITSMTFGATGMSAKFANAVGGAQKNNGYELVTPSTTPAAVSVTWAAAPDNSFLAAVAFSGVDQSTPSDAAPAASTGTSATPSHTITKGEDGDVRICMFSCGTGSSATFTNGSNEVQRANGTVGANPYINGFYVGTKEDNGTDAFNPTISAVRNWFARGWNINMASEGGSSVLPIFQRPLRVWTKVRNYGR